MKSPIANMLAINSPLFHYDYVLIPLHSHSLPPNRPRAAIRYVLIP